ncbi:MAG TPA: NAD(P)/FAD-dependent oxidoreductase [Puia sp.]|nr:NAD(P)/FAD-dependent oxidoreductase [Puia sp.]
MVEIIKYHVIIIGAGPAGCSAAIKAAESGLSVLILEARRFPRQRPGETLHPGMEVLFKELGIMQEISLVDYARPEGYFCYAENESSFIGYGKDEQQDPWLGWLIPREEMDSYLLNRALSLGVRVRQCAGPLAFLGDPKTTILSGNTSYQSEYILDASGHNFWLTRQLGNTIQVMSDKIVAHYGGCQGEFAPALAAPCFYREQTSWTWVAQLKPGLCQWTHVDYRKTSIGKNWRPAVLQTMNPIGITKSRDVTWRQAVKASGTNYFCLGDAAYMLDPSSSKGVLKAVMSGMMAAHLISKVLIEKSTDPSTASAYYSRWIKDWFIHEFHELSKN